MRNWALSLYYACIPVLPISISRSMLAFNCPLAPYLEIPVTELLWLACSHFFIPLHPLRFLSLFLASPIPIQPRHFTYMVSWSPGSLLASNPPSFSFFSYGSVLPAGPVQSGPFHMPLAVLFTLISTIKNLLFNHLLVWLCPHFIPVPSERIQSQVFLISGIQWE